MSGSDPGEHGIKRVHLWAYDQLLAQVEDQPWLTKHTVPALRKSIFHQLWWQYWQLPKLLDEAEYDILFNTDAGSVCPLAKSATLSQDMLSFEPHEMKRYRFSKAWLRLLILKWVQARRLKRSQLAIFLTDYARRTIEQVAGHLPDSTIIPHGIDDMFRCHSTERRPWPQESPIRILYVSNAAPYKHQWHVASAISLLRDKGYDLELTLVGGGKGPAKDRLERTLDRLDPQRLYIQCHDFVPNSEIPDLLASSDLFVFASSCENLPITMLEAMASGIPICSSNRGPMREVLGPKGAYFDPENPNSIATTVQLMIDNPNERNAKTRDSHSRAAEYSWRRCSRETWMSLASVCRKDA